MTSVSDFSLGQRVEHTSMGTGKVESKTPETVTVAFDNSRSRGIYDDNWFRVCEPKGTTLKPLPPSF
jgi:hypothetical protein